jgi:hypothetical protein
MAQGLLQYAAARQGRRDPRPSEIPSLDIYRRAKSFAQTDPVEAGLIGASMLPVPVVSDVAGFAGDVLGMIKRPEDRTVSNAGMAALGLLPFVPAGMIAGRKALTADLEKLKQAEAMEKRGLRSATIWDQTGWERGADGLWRFEIDDSQAVVDSKTPFQKREKSLTDEMEDLERASIVISRANRKNLSRADALRSVEDQLGPLSERAKEVARAYDKADVEKALIYTQAQLEPERLSRMTAVEAVSHPELFAAYPDLAYTSLMRAGAGDLGFGVQGSYNSLTDEVQVDKFLKPDAERSTVLHELQHAIQSREGFAPGGAPAERLRDLVSDSAKKIIDETGALAPEFAKHLREQVDALASLNAARSLRALSKKERIQPRQVLSRSDWYEFSDKVKSAIGPRPRSTGPADQEWLRAAAERMAQLEENKVPGVLRNAFDDLSDAELQKELNKTSQKYRTAFDAGRKVQATVGWTDGTVHIQDDELKRLASMHRVNPRARQISEGGEVAHFSPTRHLPALQLKIFYRYSHFLSFSGHHEALSTMISKLTVALVSAQ